MNLAMTVDAQLPTSHSRYCQHTASAAAWPTAVVVLCGNSQRSDCHSLVTVHRETVPCRLTRHATVELRRTMPVIINCTSNDHPSPTDAVWRCWMILVSREIQDKEVVLVLTEF